jgi:hypothetical protein
MNEPDPEIFDMLLLNGAIEVSSIDPISGEFLYSMTDKMNELMPELYEEHMNEVNGQIMALWEDGFLKIDLFDTNPMVVLTEKAFDIKELLKMDTESLEYLNEIKRLLAN